MDISWQPYTDWPYKALFQSTCNNSPRLAQVPVMTHSPFNPRIGGGGGGNALVMKWKPNKFWGTRSVNSDSLAYVFILFTHFREILDYRKYILPLWELSILKHHADRQTWLRFRLLLLCLLSIAYFILKHAGFTHWQSCQSRFNLRHFCDVWLTTCISLSYRQSRFCSK
jgi:hypothetical protein